MNIGSTVTVGYEVKADGKRVPIVGIVVAMDDEFAEVQTRDGVVLYRHSK